MTMKTILIVLWGCELWVVTSTLFQCPTDKRTGACYVSWPFKVMSSLPNTFQCKGKLARSLERNLLWDIGRGNAHRGIHNQFNIVNIRSNRYWSGLKPQQSPNQNILVAWQWKKTWALVSSSSWHNGQYGSPEDILANKHSAKENF